MSTNNKLPVGYASSMGATLEQAEELRRVLESIGEEV